MTSSAKPPKGAWKKHLFKLTGGTLGMKGWRQHAPLYTLSRGEGRGDKKKNRGGQKSVFENEIQQFRWWDWWKEPELPILRFHWGGGQDLHLQRGKQYPIYILPALGERMKLLWKMARLSARFNIFSTLLGPLDQRTENNSVVLYYFHAFPFVKPEYERALTSKNQNTVYLWGY